MGKDELKKDFRGEMKDIGTLVQREDLQNRLKGDVSHEINKQRILKHLHEEIEHLVEVVQTEDLSHLPELLVLLMTVHHQAEPWNTGRRRRAVREVEDLVQWLSDRVVLPKLREHVQRHLRGLLLQSIGVDIEIRDSVRSLAKAIDEFSA